MADIIETNENDRDTQLLQASLSHVIQYGTSPAALQRDALNLISKVLDNELGLISAENPIAMILEMSAIQTAGSIGRSWLLARQQYPVSAQTHDDLYPHIADLDWIGVFALPSSGEFVLSFDYNEVVEMMTPLEDGSGDLLRIPRGMRIEVADMDFLCDYPINIMRLKNGSIRVTYDTDIMSPVQSLSSNVVKSNIYYPFKETPRLILNVEMVQLREIQMVESLTSGTNAKFSRTFDDFFMYARVFHGSNATGWKEMKTTHSPDVYDPYVPTAVLKLIENADDFTLDVTIPKVYNTQINDNGQLMSSLGSRIKILIYTTVGELQLNLASYDSNQFNYDFYPSGESKRDYDGMGDYSAPLKSVKSVVVHSKSHISNGRDPLTFEELRERVINNTVGPNDIPISHLAIEDKAQDDQFRIVKSVDYVTNRAYWAVRDMPQPTQEELLTAASASVEIVNTTITDLLSTGTVIDNGQHVTITPDTVYEMINGRIRVLSKTEIERIESLSTENRAKEVNTREFFYSPFHYQLDMKNETVKIRPYYMDNPQANEKNFLGVNAKVPFSVTISNYMIYRSEEGYRVRCELKSNDAFKRLEDHKVWAQLKVLPYGDDVYSYIAGEMIGRTQEGEFVFEFPLATSFDFDEDNSLILNNASMTSGNVVPIPIALENTFRILIGNYGDTPNWSRVQIDNEIGYHLVDEDDAKAVVMESINVRLGHYLEYLWARARTYADEISYQRYTEDVPLLYTEDQYEADPVTGSIVNVVNGQVRYNITHRAGEQVVDTHGNLVFKHRSGDVKLDSNGQPMVKEPRAISRRLEMMMVDGVYRFANNALATEYRNEIVETFLDWITDDLAKLNEKTLEQTKIYFYPSATLGNIKVMYNNGVETYIPAAQSIIVDLTVAPQVYTNEDVLEKIRESTVGILNEHLKKVTVSKSNIIKSLVEEYGDDVIGVDIRNLGGVTRIVSFTVVDNGKHCTLRKKLTVESDELLSVGVDVTFNFIVHSPAMKEINAAE